jgi:malto-oligosyltrehalose trehalohydrolase
MLDVVYNHFGPEGNYLAHYAPPFFTERHCTPWGAAINFDGADARPVRDFYIHNTLYWLEEYHLDGLRYDAVHAIRDDSTPHILSEIARAARSGPGRTRPVYLVLENAANQAHFLGAPGAPDGFDAQWNDDLHHCLHVLLTRESDGYYADYAQHPQALLCRCLAEGFAYQGEHSAHEGHARGEPSRHLPPSAFVNFLQNHDQIGNRALGERIAQLTQDEERLRAIVSVLLLAPSPPLVFMGEEWAAASPFPYFCDFEPELASKVREGRRREFSRFLKFSAGDIEQPPDPAASETLRSASLDWNEPAREPHARMLDHYRRLIALRHREIAPRIPEVRSGTCLKIAGDGAFTVDYLLADGSILHLITNLSERVVATKQRPAGRLIFATHPNIRAAVQREELEPWSVTWLLERPNAGT